VAEVKQIVGMEALASRVGRDFEAVSAQLHAAPAACSFLAGVIEMKNALSALADTIMIHTCEHNFAALSATGANRRHPAEHKPLKLEPR
jgi:hypothetical protein